MNRLVPAQGQSVIRSLAGIQGLLGQKMMLLVQLPAVWRTGTWGTSWLLVTDSAAHPQFVNSEIAFGDLSVEVAGRHDAQLARLRGRRRPAGRHR